MQGRKNNNKKRGQKKVLGTQSKDKRIVFFSIILHKLYILFLVYIREEH